MPAPQKLVMNLVLILIILVILSRLFIFHQCTNLMNVPDCRTTSGEDCVFPFKFKGVVYDKCTGVETVSGGSWCSTEVDSNGGHVEGKYGECDSMCSGNFIV